MLSQKLIKAAGVALLALVAQVSFAQKQVSGKVTDSKDGVGVGGVTVVAKGAKNGTQTAPDGSFSISVPSGVATLVFTFVGYARQEVSI